MVILTPLITRCISYKDFLRYHLIKFAMLSIKLCYAVSQSNKIKILGFVKFLGLSNIDQKNDCLVGQKRLYFGQKKTLTFNGCLPVFMLKGYVQGLLQREFRGSSQCPSPKVPKSKVLP